MSNSDGVATLRTAAGFILFAVNLDHQFDPDCFNEVSLDEQGLLISKATAGRGNTFFFRWHKHILVLRHYRRGGLIRHFVSRHYCYTGARRTRAAQEFSMLTQLHLKGLPVSQPYACRVDRAGLFYSASLVTFRVAGKTIAERLLSNGCLSFDERNNEILWRALGSVIARFHNAGVYHADLNAHNILLDEDGHIVLIDFDRARFRKVNEQRDWRLENIRRFERSLKKIAGQPHTTKLTVESVSECFGWCLQEWERSLAVHRSGFDH